MAIHNGAPGHDYKVLLTVAKPRDMSDNNGLWAFPTLCFNCHVRIKYVSDKIDARIPITHITQYDSSSFFDLPMDELTCDNNFSSYQPENFVWKMLGLMNIPFQLDRLFLRTSIPNEKSVPLKNSGNVVSHILDTARVVADEIGLPGKSNLLVVLIEKIVTVPYSEYVKMLMEIRPDLFCKIGDQNVTLRQLKIQRPNHSISTMKQHEHHQPPMLLQC
ncbi:hypothetical protein CCACVL1_04600 [Corchorus capsularis]|uniref:Uncharacterized protein n=1 Tax=Corchorus capsularis TaxID=210143 RepID=A0A1R3JR71_COCAP|nr:hypothetical protein CCACVL1_04600 [Corchorus capsularis]